MDLTLWPSEPQSVSSPSRVASASGKPPPTAATAAGHHDCQWPGGPGRPVVHWAPLHWQPEPQLRPLVLPAGLSGHRGGGSGWLHTQAGWQVTGRSG